MSKRQEAKRVRIDGQPERRAKIVALASQPDIRDVLKAVFLPAEKRKKNCSTKKSVPTISKNLKIDKNHDTDKTD